MPTYYTVATITLSTLAAFEGVSILWALSVLLTNTETTAKKTETRSAWIPRDSAEGSSAMPHGFAGTVAAGA